MTQQESFICGDEMLVGLNPNIYVQEPYDAGIRAQVSACLVSREPIDPQILKTLEGFGEVIVGDGTNGPYGRFEAIKRAKYDIIYTQDDDCVVDVPALMSQWDGHFISNMKANRLSEYPANITLTGWGAMFRKELIDVLDKYTSKWGFDELFMRECDRVFPGLNTHKNVFVDVENLPNAFHPNRLSAHPKHWEYLEQIRGRVRELGGS
jgi:hypothetical protein